ncbi:trypsin-like peptidase [Rhizobium sp. PP-WC-1G-195]|nr:trypsin-like peptidase [Rhizobium sp. PP-WC-1G-195]
MTDAFKREAVWKEAISRVWVDQKPVGTAFVIGPRIALTCHHCAIGQGVIELRGLAGDGTEWRRTVEDVCFAEFPLEADAALLRFSQDAETVLPISTQRISSFGHLTAYGYPGENTRQGIVRIDVQSRGLKSFDYGKYALPEGLSLAGDPASAGMSGSPVLDTSTGIVIAMIVGGPDYDGRATAIPLWLLDDSTNKFPAFDAGAVSNRRSITHYGWAMNQLRANELCHHQVENALVRLQDQGRFDPARVVLRDHLTHALASFLTSEIPAFITTSGPNSGKTYAMATSARSLSGRSLFLEAYQVADTRNGFASAIQDLLGPMANAGTGETLELLTETLKHSGGPLVVFIDGINEISDDIAKVERWVSQAISHSKAHGIKVVISCRTDFWSVLDLSDAAPASYELGYFSRNEAERASETYGAGRELSSDLGRHPLMFKILSSLRNSADLTSTGRFSAIQAFVQRLIALTQGVTDVQGSFGAFKRIVAEIAAEQESIPWEVAANALGGSQFVDRFIASGLFRTSDRMSVRFAYDEITEALRPPLQNDLATLTGVWRKAFLDGRLATRALGDLTRVASENDEHAVATHANAFYLAFADFRKSTERDFRLLYGGSIAPFDGILASLASDIPAQFSAVSEGMIKLFLDAIVELARSSPHHYWQHHLVPAIKGLDIPLNLKFGFLTDLLALCPDDNLREKDIFDRGGAKDLLAEASSPTTIAAALLRISLDGPVQFAHLAVPLIDDDRRLQDRREATVGGVLMAILRINALACFDELFLLLVGNTNSENARLLLHLVSIAHPTEAIACAADSLSTSRAIAMMDLVIEPSLKSLGPGLAPVSLIQKLRAIMCESTPNTRALAASLIRISEPDDLAAWDELADAARARTQSRNLYPVPAARAAEFLRVLGERGDRYAIAQMREVIGDNRLEAQMADIATHLFEKDLTLHYDLAALAEQRLYQARDAAFFSPWMAFGLKVAASPSFETRQRLIYFAGPRSGPSPLSLQIWEELLRGPVGLAIAVEGFDLVLELELKTSSVEPLMYLRPIAREHGEALRGALREPVNGQRPLLENFDNDGSRRTQIDHTLELLVQALEETHPEFANQLRKERQTAQDWVDVWDPPGKVTQLPTS